ncbi:MAG: DUF4249 domain-containing protein [Bacteroidales bacterium]|nr:DUF4249 domain-containing protein [Bacteroidales bacterium]
MRKVLYLILIITMISCSKEIDLDLPSPTLKYVVEGYIQNDAYPVVVLTRNMPYFAPVDTSFLMDSLFVTNAFVTVSNGFEIDTLELKIDLPRILNKTWPFVYYQGKKIKGQLGGQYQLYVKIGDHTITGETTIPSSIYYFDTLWWKPDPTINNDSLGYIWIKATDNPLEKNYYRIFTKRLGRDFDFVPIFGSIYEDTYISGKNIDFYLTRGVKSIEDDSAFADPEFGRFKLGDTVVVKLSSIDKAHYEFWRTLEEEIFSAGSPMTNPTPIRHNVKGALGVFGGYASSYDTMVVKP